MYISSKFYSSKLEGTENCITLTKTIYIKTGKKQHAIMLHKYIFYEMRKQKKVRFWVVWIYNLFFSSFIRLPKGKLLTSDNKPASYSQCWSIQLLLFYQKSHKDVEPSKVPLAESAQWSLTQKTFNSEWNALTHFATLPNYYIPKMAVFTGKKYTLSSRCNRSPFKTRYQTNCQPLIHFKEIWLVHSLKFYNILVDLVIQNFYFGS